MWNDEQTDATLLDSGFTRSFQIIDGQAAVLQDYYYPSRNDCMVCHTPESGYVIGVKTAQINKDHLYDTISDNQLRSYNHIRLFTTDIGEDYSSFPKLVNPQDSTAGIENRARAYLDANCANCHLPGGSGRSNMDLRSEIALEEAYLIDEPAMLDNMGIENALRLKPGAADSSILYLRLINTREFRMPPLATSVVDQAGASLLKEWIDSLGVAMNISVGKTTVGKFALYPAYPNPFNPITKISFELAHPSEMQLSVYNLLGQKVAVIFDGRKPAGRYISEWNAAQFASGVYLLRMTTSLGFVQVRKLILLK